jgi:hypothetical protein
MMTWLLLMCVAIAIMCAMQTSRLIRLRECFDSPGPWTSPQSVAPEGDLCVIAYTLPNYGGLATCVRQGQYLDPTDIAKLSAMRSLRVPQGVLLQMFGFAGESFTVNTESGLSDWSPQWPIAEILIGRSALIGALPVYFPTAIPEPAADDAAQAGTPAPCIACDLVPFQFSAAPEKNSTV